MAKDTAIYGLSSIIGRFLNWCLVPLYVYLFPAEDYGIVSYLYSFTAVALIILTYGMETGFFRYANRHEEPDTVYTTSLISIGTTSLAFIILISVFFHPVANALLLPKHPWFVWMLGVTVAIDAFTNIPFAYLRYKKRPYKFAGIKLLNVGINIGLNLFFLLCCPAISKGGAHWLVDWFYAPLGKETFGIGWIFLANILSTVCVLLLLLPYIIRREWKFEGSLLKMMLSYSWPLLILGVAGILSQNMGQMIIPYLFEGKEAAAREMVGIYGANIKIAIVMVMFTQAFRYAYEPFIFSQAKSKGEEKTQAYCDAMKYFVIFGLFIFLGVMYFLPILKHFIAPSYWGGLRVVPIMMVAELFGGVFFNLSIWYKLTDRTRWGMYLSLICFFVMLGFNIWLIPLIGIPDGYMGAAWSALIAYFVVMALSYFIGRRYYPLPYQLGRMALFSVIAVILYIAGGLLEFPAMWLTYVIRVGLLAVYCAAIYFIDIKKITFRPSIKLV